MRVRVECVVAKVFMKLIPRRNGSKSEGSDVYFNVTLQCAAAVVIGVHAAAEIFRNLVGAFYTFGIIHCILMGMAHLVS